MALKICVMPGKHRHHQPHMIWQFPGTEAELKAAIENGNYPYGPRASAGTKTLDRSVEWNNDGALALALHGNAVAWFRLDGETFYLDATSKLRPEREDPTPGVPGLVVYVDEEYGYRSYRLDYPGTAEQLAQEFQENRLDFSRMVELDEAPRPHNAYIHLHNPGDTILVVNGVRYYPEGAYNDVPQFYARQAAEEAAFGE